MVSSSYLEDLLDSWSLTLLFIPSSTLPDDLSHLSGVEDNEVNNLPAGQFMVDTHTDVSFTQCGNLLAAPQFPSTR